MQRVHERGGPGHGLSGSDRPRIVVHPATPDRWPDLESVFGPRGASAGCWCMFFRKPRAAWERECRENGRGNRRDLKALVGEGREPGLLAYVDGEPAGWVALAPRREYPRLDRSPIAKAAEAPGEGTWSITCFYVARRYRRQGVAEALLEAAIEHARRRGAKVLEAYPVDPGPTGRADTAAAYHGVTPMFEAAGFREVGRAYPTRPLMRRRLPKR